MHEDSTPNAATRFLDVVCANLDNLLATVNPERGEWIRATVRNLIAMNG